MKVLFSHYRHEFDESTLMRWTSPHFSEREAGRELRSIVVMQAGAPVFTTHYEFKRAQLLCANEVFPEAAIADPAADLAVWDEWRDGSRAFPYPGKYSRLGIRMQEGKTSSTTSLGVIGEAFAGLFSQAYVAPCVLVRVVRRWPDFIFYTSDGRYAFVEAKATMGGADHAADVRHLPEETLGACLLDGARQLNTDPFVRVWLAFTVVDSIEPFEASVVLLELDAPDRRREQVSMRVMPAAVIGGLAQRALVGGAARMNMEELAELTKRHGGRKNVAEKEAQRILMQLSYEEIEGVLADGAPDELLAPARREIEGQIRQQVERAYLPAGGAWRFEKAKAIAAAGQLALVRPVGVEQLFLADMPNDIRVEMQKAWEPRWDQVHQPWGRIDKHELWRGSSAVLALGGPGLAGRHVRDAVGA